MNPYQELSLSEMEDHQVELDANWRPIVGYEHSYEVNNHGQVRSIDRIVIRRNNSPQPRKGGLLKQSTTDRGYKKAFLYDGKGKKRSLFVHGLVAEAFISKRPQGKEVNHLDGKRHNNVSTNLEWATHANNIQYSFRKGFRSSKGERNNYAKLTEAQVKTILKERETNTLSTLATKYGVTLSTISKVCRGINWSHLEG